MVPVAPPAPSGQNGAMGYLQAPVAGAYEAAGQLGSAVQAGAKLVGATGVAQSAADFAARQRATAATYQSPELEKLPWYDPRGLAYGVLKGAPQMAGMIGAAAAAPEGAAALAAGAVAYPLMVGGNVQASEAARGPLTSEQAAKAAVLGVPEAALAAWTGGKAAGVLSGGAKGTIAQHAASQAYTQALASAGQDFIAQQMGDPNRGFADRMSDIIHSAITGGITGGIVGGALHGVSKLAPARLAAEPETIASVVDAALEPKLLPPPAVRAGPPLDTLSAEDVLARARAGDTAAMQEMTRRAGPSGAQEIPETEPVIPQPDTEHVGLVNEAPAQEAPTLAETEHLPGVEGLESADPAQRQAAAEALVAQRAEQARQEVLTRPEQEAVIPQPDTEHVGLVNEPGPAPAGPEGPSLAEAQDIPKEPAAAMRGDELRAMLKQEKLPAPSWLDTSDYQSAKSSILREIKVQGPDDPPLRGTAKQRDAQARVLAERLGLLDENGNPKQAPIDAPHRSEVPPKFQTRWDALEKLRDETADKPALTKRIDDAQTQLATPKGGTNLVVDAETAKIKADAAKGEQAKIDLETMYSISLLIITELGLNSTSLR